MTELFIILVVVGLMSIGAEIFVPGGIIGTIGAMALGVAMVLSFWVFPGYGLVVSALVLVFLGVVVVLWIKIFPKTGIGRRMTVETHLGTFKAGQTGLPELLGREGEAHSELRPAGFALFEGRRVDVVTQGEMIARGERVRVVAVEGNRVVVVRVG